MVFHSHPMVSKHPLSIRLEFSSTFDMVDFVEVVGGHVSRDIGLDEDSVHWVGVAIRECVINAIKHGNQHDISKRVFVEFATALQGVPEMIIRVRDEGSGRGIFLIRNFMDEVDLQRAPQGGMEVRMVKRGQSITASDTSVGI